MHPPGGLHSAQSLEIAEAAGGAIAGAALSELSSHRFGRLALRQRSLNRRASLRASVA